MNNEGTINAPIDEPDELYHYGVQGMKWGVRRTPAQLGHKTGSKKRRTKAKAYVEKLMQQHKAKKSEKDAKKAAEKARDEVRKAEAERMSKPVSKMTNAELAEYVSRKNAERTAYQLQRDIEALNPKQVSKGKQFAEAFGRKAMDAAVEGGNRLLKNAMNKAIDKALGQGAHDPLRKLKEEADKAGYEQIKANARTAIAKADYQENLVREQNHKYNSAVAAEKAAADEAARQANDQRSRQEYEKTGGAYSRSYNKSSDKVYEGVVVEGSGSKKSSSSTQNAQRKPVIDSEGWVVSDAPSSTKSSGQSYVSRYLSTPVSDTSNRTTQLGQTYIAGYLPAPKDDD